MLQLIFLPAKKTAVNCADLQGTRAVKIFSIHPLPLHVTDTASKLKSVILYYIPKGSHSHILMTGGPSEFFGSEILAKGDFFGSMKDAGIFWGHEKKKRRDFFGLQKKKKKRNFFGYVRKSSDFFG